jgi:hypothetical protein
LARIDYTLQAHGYHAEKAGVAHASRPVDVWLRRAYRLRYLVLVAWGVLWLLPPSHYSLAGLNDWLPFEIGARTLVHYHHMPVFSTPALHVYADNPQLQFGPLPLLLLAPFQSLSPHSVAIGFGMAMVAAGVASMAALESAARRLLPTSTQPTLSLVAFLLGIELVPVWSFEVGYWHHLDDVLTVLLVSGAAALIAREGPWWACGLLLGTAAATRPWGIICVPLLLALPRAQRAGTALVTFVAAVAWWLPFVMAAPATVTSMLDFQPVAGAGSVPHLLGLEGNAAGWLQPLQIIAGMTAVAVMVRRGGWESAMLAGMAVRTLLEPTAYSFYLFGPVMAALLVDLSRIDRTRIPRWTISTLALLWALPRLNTHTPLWGVTFGSVHLPTWIAAARVLWSVAVLAVLFAPRLVPALRPVRPREAQPTTG